MVVLNARKLVQWTLLLALLVGAGYGIWWLQSDVQSVFGWEDGPVSTWDIVTVEYKGTHPQTGKVVELYRFDPATIVVGAGERVRLNIYGLHGERHPFVIEGLSIKDEVVKGEVTTVEFVAKEKGTYRLLCLTHADHNSAGPMVAYIVVQ